MRKVPACGPKAARIAIVGEAPGQTETEQGMPFVGASGLELTRMLSELGVDRRDCFITNVCKYQPPHNDISEFFFTPAQGRKQNIPPIGTRYPNAQIREGVEELAHELAVVKPELIIALGDTALWAVTGESGITKWRGSMLYAPAIGLPDTKVMPTYHPAAILRQWNWRYVAMHDLRRALQCKVPTWPVPDYDFLVRPSFDKVMERLCAIENDLVVGPVELSVDIETRLGHIACLGIATSALSAFCIPFMCIERANGYWTVAEEAMIVYKLKEVLCHPNAQVIGQNFLYDAQYIAKWWGFLPRVAFDTMICHHTLFPGDLPKGLDFLSSLYCQYHRYWKDEGKKWDASVGEEQLWVYNCKDAVVTFECKQAIQQAALALGQTEQLNFQMSMFMPVLEVMLRGVRWDKTKVGAMAMELMARMSEYESFFERVMPPHVIVKGKTPWYRSPKQLAELMYVRLGFEPIRDRKTKQVTTNDDAMKKIGHREPLLKPVCDKILEYRTLGIFAKNFLSTQVEDGRIRCSYNIAGTETFRFSSSEDAFGYGTNLQNIPKYEAEGTVFDRSLPNVKQAFIPDPGCVIAEIDLDRADAQVVAWEAGDARLKQVLRQNIDIHTGNAKLVGITRYQAKQAVHATNYGASARTLSIVLGISMEKAEYFQNVWFAEHYPIKQWHERVMHSLLTKRAVRNIFGNTRRYLGRVDGGLLGQALAWVPQSTVGLIINRGWLNVRRELPQVKPLLQVHDSLVVQFPKSELDNGILDRIRDLMSIPLPYADPLTIPVGISVSDKSWGDCKGAK